MNARGVRLGVALGCAALTFGFLVAGFPYDRLEQRVIRQLESQLGGRVAYASSSHVFTWAGPALQWEDLEIAGATPRPLQLARARARLAWSLDWLRLAPAFHVDLDANPGRVAGVVSVGRAPGFDGRLEAFPLANVPKRFLWPNASVTGVVDADIDVSSSGERPEGDVHFEARDGSLGGWRFRQGLPFKQLTGTLTLGGDGWAEIESFEIEGPFLTADAKGSIGDAPSFGAAPLDLEVELVADARAHSVLSGFGVKLKRTGPTQLRIAGTAAEPRVR